MMYGYYGDWGMGYPFLGGLMMFLFWAVFIIFIVWLVRRSRFYDWPRGRSALDILKERYAKGEINKEEFESKKKDLAE